MKVNHLVDPPLVVPHTAELNGVEEHRVGLVSFRADAHGVLEQRVGLVEAPVQLGHHALHIKRDPAQKGLRHAVGDLAHRPHASVGRLQNTQPNQ